MCHLLTRYQSTIFPNHKSCVRKKGVPIEDFNNFYSNIKSNQTSVLTKKFDELCSSTNDIQLLIKEVNLITPENIHLNSFMFEPLVDMSVWRLKKLYQDTKMQFV